MKNSLLKQILKLTVTGLACAALTIGVPTPTPPAPGNIGNEQEIEELDAGGDRGEDPEVSPQNDKDEDDIINFLK